MRNASGIRFSLKPYEAAYVLRTSEAAVRSDLRRGTLATVWTGRHRTVCPDALAERLADDPLALLVLEHLLDGSISAPRSWETDTPAPDLLLSITDLI